MTDLLQVRVTNSDNPEAIRALETPLTIDSESIKPEDLVMMPALPELPEV
jgi:hypothetical protein